MNRYKKAVIDARPQLDGEPASQLLISGESIIDRHIRLAKRLGCPEIVIVREGEMMPETKGALVLSTTTIYREGSSKVVWTLRNKADLKNAQGELERAELFTISKHTFRPLGKQLAAWLFSHTGVKANHLTLLRIASGLYGAVLFWEGANLLAGICVLFSWFLDLTDGQLARLRGEMSKFGSYLDSVGDGVVDNLYYLAIAWAWYVRTADESAIFLGAACLFGKYVFVNSTLLAPMILGTAVAKVETKKPAPASLPRRVVKAVISKMDETDIRYHFLGFVAILGMPELALIFHAIYFNARWLMNLANAFYKFELKKETT